MQNVHFSAQVRKQPGVSIIDIRGEINSFADSALSVAYNEAIADHPQKVVLNFTQVSYINSTGIALIVGLLAEARKTHTQLFVYGLSDHYKEIFDITRLSDFMSIYPDEKHALAGA
jgi:anti-anti-sigma factor